MYEKRLKAVAPQLFLANGTTLGRINIATASLFKVKQKVTLYSTTQGMQNFEVKRVESATILYVGPVNNGQSQTKITDRSDISGFLVADGAWLSADEQPRPNIPEQEIERLTYEEEPTVARRVVIVDPCGDKIDKTNPLPVTIDGVKIDADLEVRLRRKNDDPNLGDEHDSIRIGNQVLELDYKETCDPGKGEARVVDTLHCGGINKIIIVTDTPVEVKIGALAKSDRKTILVQPLAKGIYWGFASNITPDETPTGGAPLYNRQPLEVDAEANTPVYLVGPATGAKVYISEA